MSAQKYPAAMTRLLNAFSIEAKRLLEDEADTSSMRKALSETLLNPSGQLPPPRRGELPQREVFLSNLVSDYSELFTSYDILVDFPSLARSIPPKRSKWMKGRAITFWREAYLNEFYIFLCRLESYIKRITKAYRKDARIPKLPEISKVLLKLINERLHPIISIRGTHVHESRYVNGDPELHRLGILELLVNQGTMNGLRGRYNDAIRNAKKQSTLNFKNHTAEAKNALKITFESFEWFMLDSELRLVYPIQIQNEQGNQSKSKT